MDLSIFLILVQDGVVNGAIYALLALSLVLVFAVTRVILVAQGEFVAFGGLTYAALATGQTPGALWLLCGLGIGAFVGGVWQERGRMRGVAVVRHALFTLAVPAVITMATVILAPRQSGALVEVLLAVAIVTPMAPYLYRIAFQPLGNASVLTLLITAVALHLALTGLGLVFFGPEGFRAPPFSDATVFAGPLIIPGQAVWILGITLALMSGLYAFFEKTLTGKALRATAVNRLGARLVGIPTAQAGVIAFGLAGFIGALSGVLIVPLTTVYYDGGFMIGLRGFTAAIIGGLGSYPGAVLAALLVGVAESFSSFWASAFKEVIVFTAILPVLLWRSLRQGHGEDEE